MENLRRILNASWRLERWITWILHQSPNNTLAAALIDEVFKSSISHHLLFLSHLSRPSPIMAKETLCCVCRSDRRWPTEKFKVLAVKQGVVVLGVLIWPNGNMEMICQYLKKIYFIFVQCSTDSLGWWWIRQPSTKLSLSKVHDSANSPMPLIANQRWTIIILVKMGHLPSPLTSFPHPFCTRWCIQYHNHAWLHLSSWLREEENMQGWRSWCVYARLLTGAEGETVHLRDCVDSAAARSKCQGASRARLCCGKPLIRWLTYSAAPPPPTSQLHLLNYQLPSPTSSTLPFTNMIPPEGFPQTSFLINACGWWDHPVSAN